MVDALRGPRRPRRASTTEDGRSFEGPALIGADGIRSRTARSCSTTASRCRSATWRIAPSCRWPSVAADVPRDVVVLWAGPGFHIVHYPLRHGTLFNIVAVFRTSTHAERGDVAAYRAELEHTYRDAHPAMKALLAMMDLGRR